MGCGISAVRSSNIHVRQRVCCLGLTYTLNPKQRVCCLGHALYPELHPPCSTRVMPYTLNSPHSPPPAPALVPSLPPPHCSTCCRAHTLCAVAEVYWCSVILPGLYRD